MLQNKTVLTISCRTLDLIALLSKLFIHGGVFLNLITYGNHLVWFRSKWCRAFVPIRIPVQQLV